MPISEIDVLVALCEQGAQQGWKGVKLNQLASRFSTSKQTILRRLRLLESKNLIKRRKHGRQHQVWITEHGIAFLVRTKRVIERVLENQPHELVLSGRVVDGMGEGKYYVGQRFYRLQFKEKLGFSPYPGTLDLMVDRNSVGDLELLRNQPGLLVKGFKTKNRTFGDVRVFPARIHNTECAVVFPERGHHRDIIEIVAPQNLRRSLGLKNGDRVEVRVWTRT